MGKTGSALDRGMMNALKDLSNKAAAKDAEKVKDDFKKVNLRRPMD